MCSSCGEMRSTSTMLFYLFILIVLCDYFFNFLPTSCYKSALKMGILHLHSERG